MASDFIEVEILNWGKHQRKDVKKPSWFALDNRILEDSKLFCLTDSEWKALLYVFSQASQQYTSSIIRLDLAHAKRVCEISEKTMRSALDKLENVHVTRTLHANHVDGTDTSHHMIGHDKTGQDRIVQDSAVVQNTPTPTEIRSSGDLISILPENIRNLYDDPQYVPRESIKAWAWCENNPKKKPKTVRGWRQFFSGWLERGWERYRKSLPSIALDPGKSYDWDEITNTQGAS